MRVVADIPDELYEYLKPHIPRTMSNKKAAELFVLLHKALIVDGVPLPKGHGRLIDEKEILNNPDGIYYDLYDVPAYLEQCIPTVIEADKETEDEDSD